MDFLGPLYLTMCGCPPFPHCRHCISIMWFQWRTRSEIWRHKQSEIGRELGRAHKSYVLYSATGPRALTASSFDLVGGGEDQRNETEILNGARSMTEFDGRSAFTAPCPSDKLLSRMAGTAGSARADNSTRQINVSCPCIYRVAQKSYSPQKIDKSHKFWLKTC